MALSASIDDLKATIGRRGGAAMANRFVVYFAHPSKKGSGILGQFLPTTGAEISGVIGSIAQTMVGGGRTNLGAFISDPRDLSLLCESTSLPGRTISTQEHYTDMKAIKKPYGFIAEDVSFTFLLTNDFYCHKYFQTWQDSIIRTDGNMRNIAYRGDYTTDVTIQQVSGLDLIPVSSVRLVEAYPIGVSAVELSNNSTSTISRVTVQMAYSYFETESFAQGLNSGGAAGFASRLRSLF